jgi:predicted naringenin-chalcone synthase
MRLYEKEALPLAIKAVRNCMEQLPAFDLKAITHLIVVSCTGMYAPGLDIGLVEALGLSEHTERTCIQFMGCYAAFNAMKSADYICRAEPTAKVLVVSLELCTLHFQKAKGRDQLVSNALFGDGAAALLLSGKTLTDRHSLCLDGFFSALATDGKKDMAWHIADHGFEMTLSSYVPLAIQGGIRKLTDQLLDRMELALDEVDYFAVHPGGRRILEVCEEQLGMKPRDNRFAYDVLSRYGNMSSPTVLFVLAEIFNVIKETGGPADHKKILSFAFGPGLTLESMLLSVSPARDIPLRQQEHEKKKIRSEAVLP